LIHALHFAERTQAGTGLKVRVGIAAGTIEMLHTPEHIVLGFFFAVVYSGPYILRRGLREGKRDPKQTNQNFTAHA
jgi:hypothetical protein